MTRNLVICCDGTANEFAADRTNVAKLCFALMKDHRRQLVFYHPGVGTMAPPGFVTGIGAQTAEVAGLAFGYGLKHDIGDAYVFIMNHYQPGDQLFLFGFSRGAYTARAVAALIHMYGLILPGNDALVPYMVEMLWAINDTDRKSKKQIGGYFKLAREFKTTLAGAECKPHFIGVWDTVSSVGWVGSPVSLPYTRDNPDIAITRHAVAIDERRAFFRTNLFATPPGRDVKQVWFPGVHCDVGGGYPEAESGLSKISLEWMMEEASAAGLLIDPVARSAILGTTNADYAKPSASARMHESLSWKWRLAEFVPKRHFDKGTARETWRINRSRRREFGPSPVVHDSAWQVPGDYAARLPPDAIRESSVWPVQAP